MAADRDVVADAAARLLATRPTVSMEEIARSAGISRATLFRRFPSRSALVAELAGRAVDAYADAVAAAQPERGPAGEAMRRVLGSLAALAPQHGLLALQPLDELVETALLERARAADDRLRELVLRGQRDGEFRVDLTAEWITTAVTWLIVGAADGLRLGRLAPRDIPRQLSETVLAALRRPNEG